MTTMAMGGEGSGRKPKAKDARLLAELRRAKAAEPPGKVMKSWKSTVRKAVAAKKKKP